MTRPTPLVGVATFFLSLSGVLPPPERLHAALLRFSLADDRMDAETRARLVTVNAPQHAHTLAQRLRMTAVVDERAALAALSCPVAYMGGTADRIVPVARHARALKRLRPDLRVELVPMAPHMLLQCRPKECAAVAKELCGGSA